MPETDLPRPTDAELEILKVLWRRGTFVAVRPGHPAYHRW